MPLSPPEANSPALAELPDRADVVVIGAGLAGLRAATNLAADGIDVVVLEARDRVGGRTLSRQVGDGTFDLGGQWLGPTQERVRALARELAAPTFPTFHQGTKVLDLHGRVRTYKRNIPSLPLPQLIDLHLTLRRLDKMAKSVPLHNPAAARRALAWDGTSLETWKRSHVRSAAVRDLLDVSTRVVFGAEPAELSLLHFLFYARSGGGLMRLVDIENGAQQDRFVGGAQSLSRGLAARLAGRVCLDAPARRIEQDDVGVTVRSDRGAVRARFAVVAVPPALAGRIDYDPGLPAVRDQLTQRVPMGSTVKCIATYERPFWRERGFSGEAVCAGGPVTVTFDNTSHDNRQPALVAFIVGRAARHWQQRSEGDRRRALLGSLARWFGPEAGEPTAIVEQDWNAEVWSRGCPVGVIPPGVLTTFGDTLRQSVGRIHFAGTETATVWNGYLEGALESGERAAREVARLL